MCPKHRNIIWWKRFQGRMAESCNKWCLVVIPSVHCQCTQLELNTYVYKLVQLLVNLLFYPFSDSYAIIMFDIMPIHFLSHPIWTCLVFVFWPVTGASSRRSACTATPWCQVVASAPRNKKPLTFHYTGGLVGILTMVCFNPHVTGW